MAGSPLRRILVTGGAGFIGSHLVKHLARRSSVYSLVNLDRLTYAGNLANLSELKESTTYRFVQGCVCDYALLRRLFEEHEFDGVIHLAAESHVDRSIRDPLSFVKANALGTATLLQVALERWRGEFKGKRFLHVSTDEVFGSLGPEGAFVESSPYDPRSPYSASKASSDHFARAYYHTYGLPVVVSNCSNNYGPNQFPEKLIPACILSILNGNAIPLYGQGDNVRDWLFVEDHVDALDRIFHRGVDGQSYNVGGRSERTNLALVESICDIVDELRGRALGTSRELITFVGDRPGHDFRYAVDCGKVESQLDWIPSTNLETGLRKTVMWYLENTGWCEDIRSGRYRTLSQVKPA